MTEHLPHLNSVQQTFHSRTDVIQQVSSKNTAKKNKQKKQDYLSCDCNSCTVRSCFLTVNQTFMFHFIACVLACLEQNYSLFLKSDKAASLQECV